MQARPRHNFLAQPHEQDASAMSSAGSVAGVPSARNGTPHPGFTSLRYHDPEAYIPLSSKGHKVARPVVEATDSEGDLSEGPSRNHRSTPPPFPSNVKSSHRSRRTSSSTSTSLALSILSDRLNTETNRVTLLSNDLDDQRRAYTLLLAKYGALQTTCSQLQIELDQYKVRFEAQQHEILKAQTVVAQVDRRRRDAEDDVVRGRQKLRQLKAGIAVQDARDGGWKLGFQQGAREAGMVFGGILKNGSSSRRVHEVLDEEAEERRRSRKSTSRGRRSSSRSEVESSGPSRSGTPTSDSRTGLRSGIAEIISRRRSISRLRNRSSSVPGRPLSTVLDGTEPPSSGIPAVPALPPRMSSDQSTPTQAPPHSAPLPTQQQDQSTASLPLRSRAGSDASTRISEFDLVSPPRSGRRPSDSDVGAIPTSSSRPPLPYQPQSTAAEHRPAHQRRHTIDGRPQTSLGMGRPSTPSDRTILGQHSATPKPPPPSAVHHLQVPGARPQSPFMNFIQKRLPLYRNRSSGSVQIAVEPPSQSPSTPSPTTTVADRRLLTPEAAEHYMDEDEEAEADELITTPAILDIISRDSDTSYFPTVSPPRRSVTPKNTYQAAPIPSGVVYPSAPVRAGTPRHGASHQLSSSSSTSTGSGSSSSSSRSGSGSVPLSSNNVRKHNEKAASPATLNRPFSSSLFSSEL